MRDAYIIACARSPMTRALKGNFAFTRIDDVAAQVMVALFKRMPGLNLSLIEDVLVGCAMPEGEQGLNVARNISILAGIPVSAAAVTINRFCASSLETIRRAAESIWCENGDLFLAGGIESMSHIPMGGFNPSLNEKLMPARSVGGREGVPLDKLGARPDAYISMGLTAENVVKKFSVTREEQDRFALTSHRKAVGAKERGKFSAEIVPIVATAKDGSEFTVSEDECPRADTSLDVLSKLQPAFVENGTVTAGNSSPLTDGVAFVLLASKPMVKKLGVKPLAKIRAMAVAGVDPAFMGMGPVEAVPKVMKKAKMKMKHIDLIELNEAFAAQSIAVIRELSLDEKKLNVNGGAIALGHPLGATGARIITTLINALIDRKLETGLATMCIAGGQGMAMVVERG